MTQYISKTALVAEIESLRRTSFTNFDEGVNAAVQTLLEALDTLEVKEANEKPASNDLEEAAHSYVDTTIEYFDSEGSPCCYSAFIAGAQWQKEQLIEKMCVFLESTDFCKYYNKEFVEEFVKAMEE